MMKLIFEQLFFLILGIFSFYLGIKGRKDKIYHEKHGGFQELPGANAGAVQKGWLMFVLFGMFWIFYAIINFLMVFKA